MVRAQSLSCVQISVTSGTVTHQAPPSMGFSRQEYWSGIPFTPIRNLPNPGDRIQVSCISRQVLYKDDYCSVTQSCLTLCNPMDCSTPGLPVLHHLLELAQTQVHRVGDAIQPSCPLSSPSPPVFNLSQHQSLF